MSASPQSNVSDFNLAENINALIDSLGPDTCWQATEPLPSEQVEELLAQVPASRRNLPADLRELYRHTAYADIGPNIFLLSLDVVVEDYEDLYGEFLNEDMPSMFAFAVDNQSRAYFCDTDGKMGNGAGAVYLCSLSSLLPRDCKLCAPSVTEFLRLSTAGLHPWLDPRFYS